MTKPAPASAHLGAEASREQRVLSRDLLPMSLREAAHPLSHVQSFIRKGRLEEGDATLTRGSPPQARTNATSITQGQSILRGVVQSSAAEAIGQDDLLTALGISDVQAAELLEACGMEMSHYSFRILTKKMNGKILTLTVLGENHE